MKCQAGALAGFGRRRQRDRTDLEQLRFEVPEPLGIRGLGGISLVLFDFQRRDHAFQHRCHRRSTVRGFGEEGADTYPFLRDGVPKYRIDIGIGVRSAGVHIVGPDDADIVPVDYGTDLVFAFETPGAVAKQDRVLCSLGFRLVGILAEPLLALREAIGGQRGIGLDFGIEEDGRVDIPVPERGVGLRIGGKGRLEKKGT